MTLGSHFIGLDAQFTLPILSRSSLLGLHLISGSKYNQGISLIPIRCPQTKIFDCCFAKTNTDLLAAIGRRKRPLSDINPITKQSKTRPESQELPQ